jgi:dolichyl-phosphate beta-glucosyltransferase
MPPSAVSIVIPAYNEQRRLPRTLEEIFEYAASSPIRVAEVIVVDDGSLDETAAAARAVADPRLRVISYTPNRGKGYAIRQGTLAAEGDLVLISDADLSTPIAELEKLHAALDDRTSIAIGSRALDPSTVLRRQAWPRQAMGKVFNRLVRMIAGAPFPDTQCGFKLLRRSDAVEIASRAFVDRFAFDVEWLVLASRMGIGVADVPVAWINSPDSRVHVVRDSLRMLSDLVRIRRHHGPYLRQHRDR